MMQIYRCKCQGNECQRILEDPPQADLALDVLTKISCFCLEDGRDVWFTRPTIRIQPEGRKD